MKEIDRLKKNREERRAKQQEILEEKTAKQSVDPGNPNWEFLCMIRDYQEQLDFNPLNDRFVLHRFFKKTLLRSSRLKSIVTDASKFQTRVKMIFKIDRSLL